jgi:hypothetical protein
MQSLTRLGYAEPQPVPQPPPGMLEAVEPDGSVLADALTEAGVTATAENHAAVQALAKLDAATLATVTGWLKTTQAKPATPKK